MLFLLLILNFAISWFNAWSVGRVWIESKMIGGLFRMTIWCGAIMSACGFTWVYIALLGILAQSFQWLPARYIEGIFSFGYLVIILPLLGSGLGITASSWAQFWRQKNLINGGIAAWNTYAQISNIVSAVRFVPEAIGNVFSAFKGDDEEDNRALLLMLAVVLVAGADHAACSASSLSAHERTLPYNFTMLPSTTTLIRRASSSALRRSASSISPFTSCGETFGLISIFFVTPVT